MQALEEKITYQSTPLHVLSMIQSDEGLLKKPEHYFGQLDDLMQRLEHWSFNADIREWHEVESLLQDKDFALLHNAYCTWETCLESRFTESLIINNETTEISAYPLWFRFERLLRRELSLLSEMDSSKKVLFVGSGPFPVSAIQLNMFTGAQIDCLEHCSDAKKQSEVLLNKLDIHDLNVMLGAGQSFDVSEYDYIFIALLAKPKDEILNHICRSAKDTVNVICRTSFGSRTLLYSPTAIENRVKRLWTVESLENVRGNDDCTISSMILRKANGGPRG